MTEEELKQKIRKIVHGDMPDHIMSDTMLRKPDELLAICRQYAEERETAATTLQPFEVQNYKRLMALESRGIEEYRDMRAAPVLTPEAVVSFINQLSPWNLKTTGIDVLEAFAAVAWINTQPTTGGEGKREAIRNILAGMHVSVDGKMSDSTRRWYEHYEVRFMALLHQYRLQVLDEVGARGPKDRPLEPEISGESSHHTRTGYNSANNAWRTILQQMREESNG